MPRLPASKIPRGGNPTYQRRQRDCHNGCKAVWKEARFWEREDARERRDERRGDRRQTGTAADGVASCSPHLSCDWLYCGCSSRGERLGDDAADPLSIITREAAAAAPLHFLSPHASSRPATIPRLPCPTSPSWLAGAAVAAAVVVVGTGLACRQQRRTVRRH